MNKEARTANTVLTKVAVQRFYDGFMVNQTWFSASIVVVKVATFTKR